MDTGRKFICALYGQQEGTRMSVARHRLYTRRSGKLMKIMSLPPTEENLNLHILRAHLQTILAKSADQDAQPDLGIRRF